MRATISTLVLLTGLIVSPQCVSAESVPEETPDLTELEQGTSAPQKWADLGKRIINEVAQETYETSQKKFAERSSKLSARQIVALHARIGFTLDQDRIYLGPPTPLDEIHRLYIGVPIMTGTRVVEILDESSAIMEFRNCSVAASFELISGKLSSSRTEVYRKFLLHNLETSKLKIDQSDFLNSLERSDRPVHVTKDQVRIFMFFGSHLYGDEEILQAVEIHYPKNTKITLAAYKEPDQPASE